MPLNHTQVHIDRALTNISVAYMQDESNFIADKVFPKVPVKKQSDLFFIYRKEDFFQDVAQERATGTESAGGDYNIDQSIPYYCRVYSFHKDVDDRERTNQDDPLNADRDASEYVSHALLLKREVLWAEKFYKKGVWALDLTFSDNGGSVRPAANGGLTGGTYWNLPVSTPIKDVRAMQVYLREETARKGNVLVLSPYVYATLMDHEDIIDRIKYVQKGLVGADLLAQVFEVDKVVVPYAIQNTEKPGKDGKYRFILSRDSALLVHTPSAPALKTPAAGYIFTWTGLQGAGAYGNNIVRIPMPWLGFDTTRIEGNMAFDMQVVCKDLGIFIEKAIKTE